MLLLISSRYAKILETNVKPWEFPQSGSKAKDGEKRERERRAKVGNNNGQLRIANATSCGARKAAWANFLLIALTAPLGGSKKHEK